MSPVLEARNLAKGYRDGPRHLPVLLEVSFALSPGERIAVTGASGVGKSTLLHLLGGLDHPDSGQVLVAGSDLGAMGEGALARWRNRHLGFVYQYHHLLGELSALENTSLPLMIRGCSRREAEKKALEMLRRVGLQERRLHRPGMLSGGERQRTAIAQALAGTPSCVLMDEPTGSLDPENARRVGELIGELSRDSDAAFVLATHNPHLAALADRVLRLEEGRLLPA